MRRAQSGFDWSGMIYSGPVPEGGMVGFRTWGGQAEQRGNWLSPTAPVSSNAAIRDLSLWPGNTAEHVSGVQIPPATQIQWGTAAPAFGQPGGGRQIELLERIPGESYGPGIPLPRE